MCCAQEADATGVDVADATDADAFDACSCVCVCMCTHSTSGGGFTCKAAATHVSASGPRLPISATMTWPGGGAPAPALPALRRMCACIPSTPATTCNGTHRTRQAQTRHAPFALAHNNTRQGSRQQRQCIHPAAWRSVQHITLGVQRVCAHAGHVHHSRRPCGVMTGAGPGVCGSPCHGPEAGAVGQGFRGSLGQRSERARLRAKRGPGDKEQSAWD